MLKEFSTFLKIKSGGIDLGTPAIELKNITKTFGSIVANKDVCLTVNRGEILSILGENGSGKTTLMNMISGIYFPDHGQIFIDGNEVHIRSPKDAFKYKIGMIHQHFKLVDVFSATQNIILGLKEEGGFNYKSATEKVKDICTKYGFDIDPLKKIHEMSVSEKQTVEIIKVLSYGAKTIILDEPTAVLTPQETLKLFKVLRNMRESGKAIIIITHKLHEVLSLSDNVAVLRKGEYIGTVNTCETNESQLTEMMVGKKISLDIARSEPVNAVDRLVVNNINCTNREGVKLLNNVSFTARSGEILGIAGISGSGQRELLEAIAGLQKLDSGSIIYNDAKTGKADNLRDKTPVQIRELGIRLSFVPEDRLGMGLVGNMDIVDNMMLRSYKKGKSVGDRFVVIFSKKNNLPYNRTAFLASKKVGNSVERNRARRLMKESYRSVNDQLATGYDIIFIARKTITNSKFADVKKSIEAATKRAGILKK